MKAAREWKEFYRQEREQLGEYGLLALFDRVCNVHLCNGSAIVFPHTRLSKSGHLVAAAAHAVVWSKCDTVLALGVLHRANRDDANQRGVYGEAVEIDEFSLDNFCVLVDLASRMAKRAPPRVVRRYPFLTGDDPLSLQGFDELKQLRDSGAVVVATTDPVHHGVGYNTPADRLMPRTGEQTYRFAMMSVLDQLELLSSRQYERFNAEAQAVRSDFRDVGPVLAELIPANTYALGGLEIIDYADVLNAAEPTWVAAALVKLSLEPPED
jgi:hypothetical protein